jgi:hypothetical protein
MKTKNQLLSAEEQLLQARAEGLEQAKHTDAMKAHGKILCMDAFSWVNPEWTALSKAIVSFPFPVHWVVDHELAKKMLNDYPEITSNIRSLLVYNRSTVDANRDSLNNITNILCADSLEDSLTLLRSTRKEKSVFLFTTQENKYDLWDTFDEFITIHR